MIALARVDASTLRFSRDDQVAAARREARQACADQAHDMGEWRHAGFVADDEAVCRTCGGWLFITYGSFALQPLIGARVFGTAFGSPCRPAAAPRIR